MSDTYTIRLSNCAFFAHHGLHEAEATLGQRFYVDAALEVAADRPLDEDLIDSTVNYGLVFKEIEAAMTTTRYHLIEALGLAIGKALCAKFPQIRVAEITVRKPAAPIEGVLDYVEVTVQHRA